MTKRLPKFAFSLAIASLLILTVISSNVISVKGDPLIADQQCSSVGVTYLDGVGTHEPAGQTFRPVHTSVVGFSMHVRSTNGVPTPMTTNILLGGVGGSVVGSFTFSIPSGFGGANGDWLLIQFPSGVQVTPSSTYALDLVDNSGSSGIKWTSCSTAYTNGCGYSSGSCLGGSWTFVEYAGDFSISVGSSAMTVVQGSSGSANVIVGSLSNFDSPVTLSFSASSGITASFNANPVTPSPGGTASSALTVFVPGTVDAGIYPLTITGSSGLISHSTTVSLTVISTTASDFAIAASTSTVVISPGSTGTTNILVTSYDGFNSPVSLAAAWSGTAPTDVSFTLPSPVTPAPGTTAIATLTINAGAGASAGSYVLTVSGTTGTSTRIVNVPVIISTTPAVIPPGANFALSSSISTVPIIEGLSSSATIVVTSTGGFSGPVTLTASWIGNAPSGITFALPSPITPPPGGAASSPMAITTTSAASIGSFTLRVTGTSGSVTHGTDIVVQVTQPGPKCVIATATYGSELAPEVLALRGLRDNAIMQTQAGSNFMIAFNTWYYSFSPAVADYLNGHSLERSAMKVVLYPLVAILMLSYGSFTAMSSFPEFAVLISGLLASSMIGAFYLGLPLSVLRAKIHRIRGTVKGRKLERSLAASLVFSIAALVVGESLGSSAILMITSVSTVLTTVLLSAAAVSNRVSSLLFRPSVESSRLEFAVGGQ